MGSFLKLIGNTPLVELTQLVNKSKVRVFAKIEGQNPGGSVKDRAALNMIRSALEKNQIEKNTRLIEATSGNTGIALAMIAAYYQLEIELVMPSNATRERIVTMEAYGAKVTLLDSIEDCRDYAEEKSKKPGYFMLDQFANDNNYLAHYQTTGPEIWRDTYGNITHFVSSMGTTGTIMGTSMFLKEKNQGIQIVGCQPTEGSAIPGIRRWEPAYIPKIYNRSRVDKIMDVSQQHAVETTRLLAKKEGIFCGMSSGGAAFCALELVNEIDEGVIVFICCDRGDRYVSGDLFA